MESLARLLRIRGCCRIGTIIVVGFGLLLQQLAAAEDVVRNGGFENSGASWAFLVNNAQASGQIDTNQFYDGKASYKLTNRSGVQPHVYARLVQTVPGLLPFTTYRISCYAKGEQSGIAWIGGGPGWYLRKHFPTGTFNWTNVVVEYTTEADPGDFDLMVLSESETAGTWVDDIRMEVVRSDTAKRDAVMSELARMKSEGRRRVEQVRERMQGESRAAKDAVLQLGIAVAERYLDRVESGAGGRGQSLAWSRLQLQEILGVLDETEARLSSKAAAAFFHDQPWPVSDDIRFKNGLVTTRLSTGGRGPFWFYGYGHFAQVIRDLPNFRSLGASLIQDGRAGPSSMSAEGELGPGAQDVLKGIEEAGKAGIKVDWLFSPHYFPEWAYAQQPDVRGGGPGFLTVNIDHPLARKIFRDFAEKMGSALKDKPALLSICLSNEGVYDQSGRDRYSREAFTAYLKRTHGSIEHLNGLYGSSWKTFAEVPVPATGLKQRTEENRAYYDWVRFNQHHFAEWHGWLGGVLKQKLPRVPVHAKIMVFFSLDRDKLHFGVDPELFCAATDLAGCDAYAFPEGASYNWHGHEFFYDLLHSFRGQPVFNSENHIIPDGSGPAHLSSSMTRAQFWQGGLHHQSLTTTWVWEEAADPSLVGSIFFRPGNVFGAGRAMLELNAFGREVAAINEAAPRVALLYSPASVFWEEQYKGTLFSAYTHLNFLGEPITFISEQQLAEGRAARVKCLLLPQSTHVTDETVVGLSRLAKAGVKLLAIGTNNLAWDQYHRPRTLTENLQKLAIVNLNGEIQPSSARLREALDAGGIRPPVLMDQANGRPAWNVEFRIVRDGRRALIPMINLSGTPCTVGWRQEGKLVDLLSGEPIQTSSIRLEPMVPRLLSGRNPGL